MDATIGAEQNQEASNRDGSNANMPAARRHGNFPIRAICYANEVHAANGHSAGTVALIA
jgi:hypothetical protein